MRSTSSCKTARFIHGRPMLALLAVFAGACGSADDVPLQKVDPAVSAAAAMAIRGRVTVSGVSAGGYMAVQTHVALADRVSGAGIVAGGPYHCAQGSVGNALGRCMSGDGLDVPALVSFTRQAAASGQIAATGSLQDARVWLFHGARDAVVSAAVVSALADYYREFMPAGQIKLVDDVEAVHGWPTVDTGNACLEMGGDFINACGFDTAGNLLSHLYENLEPPQAGATGGDLRSVDFSAYFATASGMSGTGYVFVPENCMDADSACRLHIAFHGCRQGAEFIGDRFASASGLNAWAAQNGIVVVYPQVESTLMNPQGCWDWWGYTGAQYDLRAGEQISAIAAMISAFAAGRLIL
ncbi:MAG: PHB depolymerase family esterase [Gammaproteobacteria bacterium]|nr:MAG: PHB depolymerase family esterase [Gammaproteobacteria bacterium]